MRRSKDIGFNGIGYWSEIKLDIVREYAVAYSRILSAQRSPSFSHVYIDAFCGAGVNISRETGEFVQGSPLNALTVEPPFCDYYLIDIDKDKITTLKETIGQRDDVHVFEGDCNSVLLKEVFPKVQFSDYRRGLCMLDPYGLHLNWQVMYTAGQMRSIDMFLNFPVMDMNRNVLWRNPDRASSRAIERMNMYWGDESWRDIAYSTNRDLFGHLQKEDIQIIAEAFGKRLQSVAGFDHVSEPLPMRNSVGAIVYYLFFASQRPVAVDIVRDIFEKYRRRGIR